jgi:hypothetical protein
MDFIKVKNKHILFEYTDMSDSVFRAWQKVMALTAFMESMPTREQMLVHVHHATLKSLDEVLMKHGCSLDEVLMKVLCDADEVKMKRDTWKRKQKEKRARLQNVSGDVPGDVSPKRREEKRREEKNKEKKESTPKVKYLDSVFLTDDEHRKLQEAMGQKSLEVGIEKLDYSITVKGGKYRDHYKTLLNWNKRGWINSNGNGSQSGTGKTPGKAQGAGASHVGDGQPYPCDGEY